MQRSIIAKRKDYLEKLENIGFEFHTDDDGEPYWNEGVYYQFTKNEIDLIETASNECYSMCVEAVDYALKNESVMESLNIPGIFREAVRKSWERDDKSIYGRFDFGFDGNNLKLFEFNADTPTSLYEASIVQWNWKEELFPYSDQFNLIHENLVQSWKDVNQGEKVYFSCVKDTLEDYSTVMYLKETADQAGLLTDFIYTEDMGIDDQGSLTDLNQNKINTCFKLYPWEWMQEEFPDLVHLQVNWYEPLWKTMMSNKGILAVMSRLFPSSRWLLKTGFEMTSKSCVKKPIHSREGSNVEIYKDGRIIAENDGLYYGKCVYQELFDLPDFNGYHPVIGSWIIGGEAAGIGIRETETLITGNWSKFVPHIF